MTTSKYNEPGTLEEKISDIDRRVRALETAPRLTSASIGEGGLIIRGGSIRIQDANGVDQVRLGPLADGTYGAEQVVDSSWVSLLQLARGVQSVSNPATLEVNAPTNGTSGWVVGGPSVSFKTYTGNLALLLVSSFYLYGYKSGTYVGFRLTNNVSGQIIQDSNISSSMKLTNPSDLEMNESGVWAGTLNIPPGAYTATMTYRTTAGFSAAAFSTFFDRGVMVFPF